MRGTKLLMPNGRKFLIVARSGSHAICWQSLPAEIKEIFADPTRRYRQWHPVLSSPYGGLAAGDTPENYCCLVRDPVERFRSACARTQISVDDALISADGHFWSLESMGALQDGVTHFRFPDQLDACAEWLGLETPVPQLNEEAEANKPTLTPEQEARVREIYAADIALWESLQP
jgi:hypothetical protein